MVSEDERIRSEEAFHDKVADEADDYQDFYYKFDLTKDLRESIFDQIGSMNDKLVLDFGCGDGWFSVNMALRGASIIGIDISKNLLKKARAAAEKNEVGGQIIFCQMNAEDLAIRGDQIDVILGNAILHHLDLGASVKEIHRVLKKGGVAYFIEPMGYNPFINAYRRLTPHKRTVDERPLTKKDTKLLADAFSNHNFEYCYALSLLAFFWLFVIKHDRMFEKTFNFLKRIDRALIAKLPFLKYLSWIVLLRVEK